jgi:hypothetical protein
VSEDFSCHRPLGHYDQLLVLFTKYSQNVQVKEDMMGRACSMHREKRTAYRILAVNPEKKGQLGRPRRRWKDYIKMDLREIR